LVDAESQDGGVHPSGFMLRHAAPCCAMLRSEASAYYASVAVARLTVTSVLEQDQHVSEVEVPQR